MNPILPSDRPARILISRADRIGDLILSTPVFAALREKFPSAWIACLTFCENREIVEGNPHLNEVILYDKKGSEKNWLGNLAFARKVARKNFDVAVHLHSTNRMHWVTWLAGIPVRIGYRRKCGWALTHGFADLKKEGLRHEAEYNFDLLGLLGLERPSRLETFFPVSSRARISLESLLNHHKIPRDIPWIAINPSASCPSKRWPAEKFGELVNELGKNREAAFIMIGTSKDRSLIESARRRAQIPVYDLSGRLSLAMLGALLERASLLISNDSGPVHIASALGTPVISLFGRNQAGLSPVRWKPLGEKSRVIWKNVGCNPCLAHDCEIHFLCLDAISVSEAAAVAETLLEPLKKKALVS